MKRIILLLLSAVMLLACVPTPETEYIVNKADNTLEKALAATPLPVVAAAVQSTEASAVPVDEPAPSAPAAFDAPVPTPVPFPSHWNDSFTAGKIDVIADADVTVPTSGVYPVYRTRERELSHADAEGMLSALLPMPTAILSGAQTKADVSAMLQAYLDEVERWAQWDAAGRPADAQPDGEEPTEEMQQAAMAEFSRMLAEAPETDTEAPASDYSAASGFTVYRLPDGTVMDVSFRPDDLMFARHETQLYTEWEYERDVQHPDNPEAKYTAYWQEVTLPEAAARATLSDALTAVGLSDFTILAAEKANRFTADNRTVTDAGWLFTLAREYGYPHTFRAGADVRLQYSDMDDLLESAPIHAETLEIFVTESGVRSFAYHYPRTVIETVNANVALLPFDEICARAENALTYGLSYYPDGVAASFTVYAAVLTSYTLRIRNDTDYYEMPCWLFLFDHTLPSGNYRAISDVRAVLVRALVINAVDGSIVNPHVGY